MARNGSYVKDLSVVDADLSRVCLVDNSPASYAVNQGSLPLLLLLPRSSAQHTLPSSLIRLEASSKLTLSRPTPASGSQRHPDRGLDQRPARRVPPRPPPHARLAALHDRRAPRPRPARVRPPRGRRDGVAHHVGCRGLGAEEGQGEGEGREIEDLALWLLRVCWTSWIVRKAGCERQREGVREWAGVARLASSLPSQGDFRAASLCEYPHSNSPHPRPQS